MSKNGNNSARAKNISIICSDVFVELALWPEKLNKIQNAFPALP